MTDTKSNRSHWWLYLIAAPAAVAIWSGWVGLGELCGFGVVNVLPGIAGGFHLNTAITLPIGVEAYAAYALGAWMSPSSPPRARDFARWSAFGALSYGMLGQVAFHLLTAAGATVAPWWVVVIVSCMPVAVLGLAAGLTHLLRVPEPETVPGPVPAAVSGDGRSEYKLPGQRRVMTELGVGQGKARRAQQWIASEIDRAKVASNGHSGGH